MDPLTGVTLFLAFSSLALEYSPSGFVAGLVLQTEICLTQNNVINAEIFVERDIEGLKW